MFKSYSKYYGHVYVFNVQPTNSMLCQKAATSHKTQKISSIFLTGISSHGPPVHTYTERCDVYHLGQGSGQNTQLIRCLILNKCVKHKDTKKINPALMVLCVVQIFQKICWNSYVILIWCRLLDQTLWHMYAIKQ